MGIVRWLKERKNRGKPYLITLDRLIERARERYTDATGYKDVFCPSCFIQRDVKTPMEFRTSKIVIDVVPIRDDQAYKCTWCYMTVHHGIPITMNDAKIEINLRGGSPWLMKPTYRPDERDMDVVKERLKKLGYIE